MTESKGIKKPETNTGDSDANIYKKLYESELEKNKKLKRTVNEKEAEIQNLEISLQRVKGNIFWKCTKPARVFIHWCLRMRDKIRTYGNIKQIIKRIKHKRNDKRVMRSYGDNSFPNADQIAEQKQYHFSKDIKFSILVPLYNTPQKYLTEMIDSVRNQTYENWELCLADGSDEEHSYVGEMCRKYTEQDSRIVYTKIENEGISVNTNKCIEMSTGEYISLFDHDDILHPSVLFETMKAICEEDADYIYTDEATFREEDINDLITLHFKPDFAIDNLRANNFVCHFSTFSRELLNKVGMFRHEFDGSQDHDMMLRLLETAEHVCHIPEILYYWRSHKQSVASDINAKHYAIDAAKRAVAGHLERCGLKGEVESSRAFPTIFHIIYELTERSLVSIIIPNKDHIDDLRRCIESINDLSSYENYEIIVVENNSVKEETFLYYELLIKQDNIKIVTYKGEFNYSAINNFGVKHAQGQYILLLNNDTQVINEDWMEEMLMYAQRPDVGAVGAKLYYGDNTIQHAGVVIGIGPHRVAAHVHYGWPKQLVGYMGRLCYAQDVTAVTGACLMVSRDAYDEVGGLSEEFSVAYNDIDLCMKLRKNGYLNVFNPYAELYHYESKSRGYENNKAKKERLDREADLFKKHWKKELEAGDPYYSPNFILDGAGFEMAENSYLKK